MKKVLIFLTAMLAMSSLYSSEVRVTGAEAERLFNSLENQYEYTSGASVSGLIIKTIVRHDKDSVNCVKESVQYGEAEATITFECILK